jgi:hypothetical protein
MARLFVAASVVALILAGCGSPAKDAPPAPRIDRLEAEAFNTVDPGCLTDAGPLDLLYRDWASEGIVARLPTSQCGLAFQAQRFISAGSFTRFQIGPLSRPFLQACLRTRSALMRAYTMCASSTAPTRTHRSIWIISVSPSTLLPHPIRWVYRATPRWPRPRHRFPLTRRIRSCSRRSTSIAPMPIADAHGRPCPH